MAMDPGLIKFVEFLDRDKIRAIYRAIAEAADVPQRSVGALLGDRCHSASWVVSSNTGEPAGYTVTLLTTASFGVSAYVIGKTPMRFPFITDVGFLVLLWVAFWPLRRDLRGARGCLVILATATLVAKMVVEATGVFGRW